MANKPRTMATFAAGIVLIVGACSSSSPTQAPPTGAAPSTPAETAAGGQPTTAPALNLPAVPTGYAELD